MTKTKVEKNVVFGDIKTVLDVRPQDKATIERYAEVIDQMPLMTVAQFDGETILIDGYHRYYATELFLKQKLADDIERMTSELGLKKDSEDWHKWRNMYIREFAVLKQKVKVAVRAFDSIDEAYKYAVRVNSKHGLPMSKRDLQRAAIRLAEMGLPDDEIATIVGRSVSTISRWMKKIRVEDKAEAQDRAFELFDAGNSYRDIADKLTKLGYKVSSSTVQRWITTPPEVEEEPEVEEATEAEESEVPHIETKAEEQKDLEAMSTEERRVYNIDSIRFELETAYNSVSNASKALKNVTAISHEDTATILDQLLDIAKNCESLTEKIQKHKKF